MQNQSNRSWTRTSLQTLLAATVVGGMLTVGQVYGRGEVEHPGLTQQEVAQADALSSAFKKVAKSVAPSVVNIVAVDRVSVRTSDGGGLRMMPGLPEDMMNDPMFRRFFEQFQGQDGLTVPDEGAPEGPRFRERSGIGTGFVVRESGYIVTNNHVVQNADEVRVRLHDGREYDADIVGTDSETDLAVLKIDASNLTPVRFGDSSTLEVGEWLVAIGSPFGLEQTVTAGIASATGRSGMGLATYENYIQTDAAINPGNSGGPLLNLYGEVIGVNTAISTRTGGYQGIGFAIPSNMVQNVMTALIEDGSVARGFLGVGYQPLTQDLARSFGLDNTNGVVVTTVQPGSPADDAGLEPGDVIVRIGERKITTPNTLLSAVASMKPGEQAEVTFIRDGQEVTIDVTLAERSAFVVANDRPMTSEGGSSSALPDLGIDVRNVSEQVAERFGLDEATGVIITAVEAGSVAERAGLAPGDIILEVNDQAISSTRAFFDTIRDENLDDGVRLFIQRGAVKRFVLLKTS